MAAQLQQPQQLDFKDIRQRGIQAILQNPTVKTQTQFNSELKRLDAFVLSKQNEELGRSGVLDISDLAKTDAATATKLSREGIKGGAKQTADDIKLERSQESAERIMSQLEDQFFGIGQHEERGTLIPDLPNLFEPLNKILGVGRAAGSALGAAPDLKTYLATLQSNRPTLARAGGNVGNLSEPEQQAAIKQLPGNFATFEEALQGFKAARRKFNLRERNVQTEISGGARTQPQTTQQQQSPANSGLSPEDEALIQQFGGR